MRIFYSSIIAKNLFISSTNIQTYVYNDQVVISEENESNLDQMTLVSDQGKFFKEMEKKFSFYREMDLFAKHKLLPPPVRPDEDEKDVKIIFILFFIVSSIYLENRTQ